MRGEVLNSGWTIEPFGEVGAADEVDDGPIIPDMYRRDFEKDLLGRRPSSSRHGVFYETRGIAGFKTVSAIRET